MNRIAVLITAAVALAILGRAAAIYRGGDPLAFGLVLLIGLGLLFGTAELLVRATRAARLQAELATLPRPATRDAVSGSSSMLRALLDAKLAGAHGVAISAPFTPYLLGLLVMLGMLGTFLGLFETLRGAREALGASGDVAALRAGLAAPMSGLSRAFGTSAAGVSASAMLGLGAVFVRRAEASFINALARYAAGPLAALTVAGRQLAALEALARQGEALPGAAASLAEAAARLASLEASLLDAQAKSAAHAAHAIRSATIATTDAIRATAGEIRADLAAGVERAATSTAAVVEPLLRATVDRSAELDAERLRTLRDAVLEMRRDLGESSIAVARQGEALGARIEGVGAVLDRIEAGAEKRLDGAASALQKAAQQLGESAAAQAAELREFTVKAETRADRLEAQAETRADQLTARAEGRLLALAEQVRASVETQVGLVERLTGTATTALAASDARAEERLTALIEASERALLAQAERLAAFEQRLDQGRGASAEALSATLAGFAKNLGDELAETAGLVREASDLLRAGGAEMASVAEMFTGAVDRYRDASDRWLVNLGAIEDAIARKEGASSDGLLGAYLDQTREVFDHSLQFQRELFLELRALKSKSS